MKALGISEDSCLDVTPDEEPEPPQLQHPSDYDLAAAMKASGNFFLKARRRE
jgi:hypothetical protein